MKIKSQAFGTLAFPKDYEVVLVTTLNKTDLAGGNNKYYQIEGHASKDGKKFRLYSRYGRVGSTGVEEERVPSQDLGSLAAAFEYLKSEKTGPRKGYVEVKLAQAKMGSSVAKEMVLSEDVKKDKVISANEKKDKKTDIHPTVEKLVVRLYTEAGQAVRNQLSGTLQTSVENPLGTLTLTQIEEGRKYLREVQELLVKKPSFKDGINTKVLDLSNAFYSAIPQVMAKRPTTVQGKDAMETWLKSMALNNEKIIDDKEELLDLLSDVQGMVSGFATTDTGKKYQEIGCDYEWLDPKDDSRRRVEEYMQKSRSGHHSWKCSVQNVWRVSVRGQKDKHVPTMKEVGNVQPLFHGSGPQNILGICKHGLLMRPPGVYITGSMFGNGLYFADQSSKSEQYAFGRFGGGSGQADTYFMFVTDVALGKIKQYESSQSNLTRAPSGFHSVQGKKGSYLVHNEFIVYDTKQHILQYLIEFKTSGRY
jgi:poly [ADP-ribose] polymerase